MANELKNVRVIICCAGNRKRWGDHLGVPKQLAPINGIPLLHRTISQYKRYGCSNIYITAFDKEFHALQGDGVNVVVPKNSILPDTGTGYSSGFWSDIGRTIVSYGDVYFTEYAMGVVATAPPNGLLWFGRYGPGKAQHCGELFCYSLPLDQQESFRKAIQYVVDAKARGETVRTTSWEVYRHLHGFDLGDHRVGEDWFEIDDATDDWDTPEDYDRWKKLFEESEKHL